MSDQIVNEFKAQIIHRLELNTPRVIKCLDLLTEEEAWKKPNDRSNSVANLILHLCGNMTQYILSSLGGMPDKRERDKEFSVNEGFDKVELGRKLSDTVDSCINVVKSLSAEELLKMRSVQGFEYTGIGIAIHVTEHYSYHTGQIALITKLITNRDTGFYKGIDLNKKNRS